MDLQVENGLILCYSLNYLLCLIGVCTDLCVITVQQSQIFWATLTEIAVKLHVTATLSNVIEQCHVACTDTPTIVNQSNISTDNRKPIITFLICQTMVLGFMYKWKFYDIGKIQVLVSRKFSTLFSINSFNYLIYFIYSIIGVLGDTCIAKSFSFLNWSYNDKKIYYVSKTRNINIDSTQTYDRTK